MLFVPNKLYYKIREVCEIVGVEAHVLRFWETEFSALSPPKSKSGQRTYRPKDIELLLQIRKLLYEDGFTIAGARKKLSGRRSASDAAGSDAAASVADIPISSIIAEPSEAGSKTVADSKADEKPSSERLRKVQTELENILTLLDRE
jgi:DNA-binding transcriptional MerR regulator